MPQNKKFFVDKEVLFTNIVTAVYEGWSKAH